MSIRRKKKKKISVRGLNRRKRLLIRGLYNVNCAK
jgi:hypothetical protein